MIYIKDTPTHRIEDALVLDEQRVEYLKNLIAKAYDQNWHNDGPNIDQINAYVAPELRTPEEAFYVAVTIISDVVNAMKEADNRKIRRK